MSEKKHVFVSIVMASYNYAEWMKEAIESVIAQTYPYWELIIVDDGSKDHSVDVIQGYAKNEPRIRLIQHPDKRNHGLPATVQRGIMEAQYPFIAFLEADDLWKPQNLERHFNIMQKTGAGLVSCHCELFGNGVRKNAIQQYIDMIHDDLLRVRFSPFEIKLLFLCKNNYIPTFSVVMARTDLLKKCDFNPPVSPWLDYWLWAQMIWMAPYVFLPEELTLWRIHGTSYNTSTVQESTDRMFPKFQEQLQAKIHKIVFSSNSFKQKLIFVTGQLLGKTLFSPNVQRIIKLYKLFRILLRKNERVLFKKTISSFLANPDFLHQQQLELISKDSIIKAQQKTISLQKDNFTTQIQELEQTRSLKETENTLSIRESIFLSFHEQASLSNTPEYQLAHAPQRVLFVIHELSLTGAPVVTLDAARVLRKNGYSPAFLTFRGGGVAEMLKSEGIPCIIDPRLEWATDILLSDMDFFNTFDAIILSSVACAPILRILRYTTPKKFWWIHETKEGFFYADNHPDFRLAKCFEPIDAVWLVSPLSVISLQKSVPGKEYQVLPYGVPTIKIQESPKHEKVNFLLIGSIIPRKAQVLFLHAIALLPEQIRQKGRFCIIGESYSPDPYPEYSTEVKSLISKMPAIELLPSQSHKKCLDFLGKADILVCPSTDDPMPVVVTEALMLGKLCICSDAIGQAAILKNGRDIITFPSGSTEALARAMEQIIRQPERLQQFTEAAKKAYHTHFSMESFEKRLMMALTIGLSPSSPKSN